MEGRKKLKGREHLLNSISNTIDGCLEGLLCVSSCKSVLIHEVPLDCIGQNRWTWWGTFLVLSWCVAFEGHWKDVGILFLFLSGWRGKEDDWLKAEVWELEVNYIGIGAGSRW